MAIQSGIGVGEAQIYDTSGSQNTYAKLMQQQQLKRQSEQKALQESLGKLKTEGLRDEDVPLYNEKYNQWKDMEILAQGTKDRQERFKYQVEAKKLYEGLNPLVYKSAEKTKNDHAIGVQILAKPHLFSKAGKEMYQRSLKAQLNSSDDIQDYTTVPVGVDLSKVGDDLTKLHKELIDNKAREANGGKLIGSVKNGEATLNQFEFTATVPAEVQKQAYKDHFLRSDTYQAYIKEKYPENFAQLPESEATELAIDAEVKAYPQQKVYTKNVQADDSFADHKRKRQYDIANPIREPKDGNSLTPSNFQIEYDKNFNYEKTVNGKSVTTANPNATFQKYVRVDPTAFALPQLGSAYNVAEGKNEKMPANSSVKLTGFGYIKTKAKNPELKATVVDSDGTEYMINIVDLPVETRNDKHVKMAYQALGKSDAPKPTGSTTSSKKVVSFSQTQERGIEAVMKKSGANREQVIEALKAAGKL